VTPDLRRQIFELAALNVPRRQIAIRLGISEGSVRYQLDKPPDRGSNGQFAPGVEQGLPPAAASVPLGPAVDPAVVDAQRRYQLEQIATAELDLRARRVEAEKRLAMLERAPGGDNGALLLVLDGLKDLRRDLEALKGRAAAPAAPTGGILEQLGQLRDGWQAVQTISGDQKAPTTEGELAVRTALDRLNMEREERARKLDFELEERRRQLDNDRIRSEAWAEQINQWGPVLLQGAQTWFAPGGGGNGAAPAGEHTADPSHAAAAMTALPNGAAVPAEALAMVEGPCPSCGVKLRIRPIPGQTDRCPRCHMALSVVEGKLWPKLPEGPIASVAG
jgi:hypothetical protein